MKIDGSCHCGFVTYEADVDPAEVYICSCADCQSISGSPFRWAVTVAEDDFKLLSGTPKTYIKQADSGATSHQLFCPECASPLYSTSVRDGPKTFNLRLGTARQRADLPPKLQCWHRSAQGWISEIDQLENIETQ